MRHNQAISSERFRRMLGLAAFTLLVAAALLSAGCGGNTSDGGGSNSGGTGTTTPPRPGGALGDTPIVISGGSIHLDMNSATFQACSGTTSPACPAPSAGDTMFWATGRISSGYYYNDNDGSPDPPYPISMTTQDITIRMVGKQGPEEGQVIIKNDRPNNRVLVEFNDTTTYKRRRPGSSWYINKKFKIENFFVKDGTAPEKDYTKEATWPSGNKVTVELIGTP